MIKKQNHAPNKQHFTHICFQIIVNYLKFELKTHIISFSFVRIKFIDYFVSMTERSNSPFSHRNGGAPVCRTKFMQFKCGRKKGSCTPSLTGIIKQASGLTIPLKCNSIA